MYDTSGAQELVGVKCTCGAQFHFVDVLEPRACMGICSTKRPDTIVIFSDCDCEDGFPKEIACPHDCPDTLTVRKDPEGQLIAHHQYCRKRPRRSGQ